jgi:hypothetical protein
MRCWESHLKPGEKHGWQLAGQHSRMRTRDRSVKHSQCLSNAWRMHGGAGIRMRGVLRFTHAVLIEGPRRQQIESLACSLCSAMCVLGSGS